MKVSFIFQMGPLIKKEHIREMYLGEDELFALLNCSKVEYPIRVGESVRLTKAVVEESVFSLKENEPMLQILLKEIDY